MKRKNDAIFGDFCRSEICSTTGFNAIGVHPDFAIVDFGMNNTTMDATPIFPTFAHQHKTIAVPLKGGYADAANDNTSINRPIAVRQIGIILEALFKESRHGSKLSIE